MRVKLYAFHPIDAEMIGVWGFPLDRMEDVLNLLNEKEADWAEEDE